MAHTKIVIKIQKLLYLASEEGGGTQGERDVALERAQRLMTKYRVDEQELAKSAGAEALPGVERQSFAEWPIGEAWKSFLSSVIGNSIGVTSIEMRYREAEEFAEKLGMEMDDLPLTIKVDLVGRPENIEYVKLLHRWLVPQLEAECEKYLISLQDEIEGEDDWTLSPLKNNAQRVTARFRKSFFDAAIILIAERLRAASEGPGTDLVRSDEADIEKFFEEDGRTPEKYNRKLHSGIGTAAGARAGMEADLNPQFRVDDPTDITKELKS